MARVGHLKAKPVGRQQATAMDNVILYKAYLESL